jgi:hypothetical protein
MEQYGSKISHQHSWSLLQAGCSLIQEPYPAPRFLPLQHPLPTQCKFFLWSRAAMNFIETLGDHACGALLGLPSLQTKRRIHCRCNCILLDLLILPCNIVNISSDNTFLLLLDILESSVARRLLYTGCYCYCCCTKNEIYSGTVASRRTETRSIWSILRSSSCAHTLFIGVETITS